MNINRKQKVTFKFGQEKLFTKNIEQVAVDINSNLIQQPSKRKSTDSPIQSIEQYNEIKKVRKQLSKCKDILEEVVKAPISVQCQNAQVVLCFNNNQLDKPQITFSDEPPAKRSFIDDTSFNKSMNKKSPKLLPPISKLRQIKRQRSPSPAELKKEPKFFQITRCDSVISSNSDATRFTEDDAQDVSEEFRSLTTEVTSIPGLDLHEKTETPNESIVIEEATTTAINAFLGRRAEGYFRKNLRSFQKMQNEEAFYSTFKCMGKECSFYTTCTKTFFSHVQHHANNKYLDNDFFLKCAYCFFGAMNAKELIVHYTDYHKHCRYQCNNCNYRSASAMSVYDHQRQFHNNSSTKIIECERIPLLDDKTIDVEGLKMKYKRRMETQSCDVCHEKFDNYKVLLQHLKECHINIDDTQMQIKSRQQKSIEEDIEDNLLGRFTCLYCQSAKRKYACDREREFRWHLQNHPAQPHLAYDSWEESIKFIKPRGDFSDKIIKLKYVYDNIDRALKIKDK